MWCIYDTETETIVGMFETYSQAWTWIADRVVDQNRMKIRAFIEKGKY